MLNSDINAEARNTELRRHFVVRSLQYVDVAFTTYDGAIGVGRDGWLLQVYGEDLADTRAQLYANYSQFYKAVTVSRPRTIGLRFSYKLGTK